jgi:serine/threonine protein kinase
MHRVAECIAGHFPIDDPVCVAGLLRPCRKIPVFPTPSFTVLSSGANCGRFVPVRNRQKSATAISFSHDELLAIFESLSNVTAKLNDSYSAHETNLFLTFTLFCALPRTMNLYDFQPWYPEGIHSFVAAGANHYIATFDETTVLKFPVVPREEKTKYPTEVQRFRSSVRAAAVKGLEVEEQILRILGKHPRIIQLKGKHEDGLLLEYLPNGSIEHYLRSNAPYITVAQRLRWGQQAAEGLAYIHTKKVIHCDISIGNLLLDRDLSIKLCDFQGKLLHSSGHVALDGGAAESIMSSMPRPNRNYQDRKTDIFAFGTALYFILTDELPFPELSIDDEDEIQRRFARQDFPPLEQLAGGDVIHNCWTGVYDDASTAMVDLQRWIAGSSC